MTGGIVGRLSQEKASAGVTESAAPDAATPTPGAAAEQPATAYPVTAEQATSAALGAAPGAALLRAPELVSVDGTPAYEVALNAGMVYVDATTGAVISGGQTYTGATPRDGGWHEHEEDDEGHEEYEERAEHRGEHND
jgi:hypothetical protein